MHPLSLQETITKLKDDLTPVWELYLYKSSIGNPELIASYKADEDMEKSIKILENNVNTFSKSSNVVFHIQTKRKPNGTWESKFDLTKDGNAVQMEGLSGMPGQNNSQLGFISPREQQLFLKEEKLNELKDSIFKKELELQMKEFQFNNDRKDFDSTVKETTEGFKELEKKYNSGTEAAKNGFSMAMWEAIKAWNDYAKNKGLSGIFQQPTTESENSSPEEKKIEEIASMIFEFKLSLLQLDQVKVFIKKFIEGITKPKEQEESENA